jgi:hypothetical protein
MKFQADSAASSRETQNMVIANSATVQVGGLVKIVNGGVEPADGASDRIYGLCSGFVVADGPTHLSNALSSQYDGTLASDNSSYTAAADNQSDKKVRAVITPIYEHDRLLAELDETKGTTTGSDTFGYYLNVDTTNETQLGEDTATASVAQCMIVDPEPPEGGDWVVVEVVERQVAQ